MTSAITRQSTSLYRSIDRLGPAPLLLGEGDARRTNGRTARVAVDVQEGVEAGALPSRFPPGDGRLAHEERIALLRTQELLK